MEAPQSNAADLYSNFMMVTTTLFTPNAAFNTIKNSSCSMMDLDIPMTEGSYFDDIFPLEILRTIFSFFDDIKTFRRAVQVNTLWFEEVHLAWREFCHKQGLLEDEKFWNERGRDWKWISLSKMIIIEDMDNASKRLDMIGCYTKRDEHTSEVWKYEGEWKNGQRHGLGTLRLPSGSTYKGEWKNGDRDGRGHLVFVNPSSSYYDGEFKHGKRHGKGLCVWVAGQWKGDRYFGDWENDYMHGYGRYTFASGAFYEGQWKEDKMHGTGTYQYRSGNQYRGQWREDKMHGKGEYHYSNGNLYVGEMFDDWKQGHGVFYYAEYGSRYEGNFTSNKPNGRGCYTWKDGDRYEGEWLDGRRVGRGRLITKAGKVYEQDWPIIPTEKHPYANGEPAKSPTLNNL